MLNTIVVVLECLPRVERRVDVNALDATGKLLLKSSERQEVVTVNEPIVEEVAVADLAWRVVGLLAVLQQNAWLQPRSLILPDPGQF